MRKPVKAHKPKARAASAKAAARVVGDLAMPAPTMAPLRLVPAVPHTVSMSTPQGWYDPKVARTAVAVAPAAFLLGAALCFVAVQYRGDIDAIASRPAASTSPATAASTAGAAPEATAGIIRTPDGEARGEKSVAKIPVIAGWKLVETYRGNRAAVENADGVRRVRPGSRLPGAGVVEDVRVENGRWAVVTTTGVIVESP